MTLAPNVGGRKCIDQIEIERYTGHQISQGRKILTPKVIIKPGSLDLQTNLTDRLLAEEAGSYSDMVECLS